MRLSEIISEKWYQGENREGNTELQTLDIEGPVKGRASVNKIKERTILAFFTLAIYLI